MKYIFKNAKILSNFEIIEGNVVVENNIITYIGKNPPKNKYDREFDVKGNILMSGFVDAHCHTPSTILRSISDDKPLNEWLDDIIPKERALSDDDIYYSTMLGIAEYVRAGITCIEENYSQLKSIVKAITKSGIRARIAVGYPRVNAEEDLSLAKQYEFVKKFGLKAVCYAHSIYGTSEENFAKLITFAKQNNLPVSTHFAETLKEVGDCTVQNNLTPAELLEDYGFLDREATLYHTVHCDKDDIKILAGLNANVVTCPSSNLKLASGIAPIYALQNAGIKIGIGTDGAYSNNSYDMFKEMFLVATLNKAILYDAKIIKAQDVLKMATLNGAEILGFNNLGDIKKGNLADLILLDIHQPHHYPHNNLISNLVYCAKSSDVYLTMINGKIVYENGKFDIGEDIEKIYQENLKRK